MCVLNLCTHRCEAIFEDRDKGSHAVNMLLTEIERYDGLVVMATNRWGGAISGGLVLGEG